MVRFMDAEVFCIDLSDFDRNEMFHYFLSRKNDKDSNGIEIVLIYNGAEYYGLATYESILKRHGEDGILTERCVLEQEDTLFADLHRIFEKNPIDTQYVPVFNCNMEILYFAYQYNTEWMELIEKYAFPYLEHNEESFSFKDLYPFIEKVCIYDYNELAFRFYKILKKWDVPVEVFGEKWKILCPLIYGNDHIRYGNVLAEHIFNIYAEGNKHFPEPENNGKLGYKLYGYDNWKVVEELLQANVMYEINMLKERIRDSGVTALSMYFPRFDQMEHYTADEFFRANLKINPERDGLNWSMPLVRQQVQKCWCHEGKHILQEAQSVAERRKDSDAFYIGDEAAALKCIGKGKHTLYLLGPCIVAGALVDEKESLGAYIYKEIEHIFGGGIQCKVYGNK